jgi:hypothetical protein
MNHKYFSWILTVHKVQNFRFLKKNATNRETKKFHNYHVTRNHQEKVWRQVNVNKKQIKRMINRHRKKWWNVKRDWDQYKSKRKNLIYCLILLRVFSIKTISCVHNQNLHSFANKCSTIQRQQSLISTIPITKTNLIT